MNAERLKRIELLGDEAAAFDAQFECAFPRVDLSTPGAYQVPEAFCSSGCYFWIMRIGTRRFKVYLGRTKLLPRRLREYANGFQPHAPNDFKLQSFHSLMSETLPNASLELHFKRLTADECKAEETRLVREFKPLLNKLPAASADERTEIQRAFEKYYRATTLRFLSDDA